MNVDLGDSSRSHSGQVVNFPTKRFTSVEFKIVQTSNGTLPNYDGQSGVGLAELSIPGIKASEVLRLPNDLFTAAGTDGSKQALSVMLTRDRANPQEPFKSDTELSMARQFTLPTDRTFGIGGTARISATATDSALDSILGRDDSTDTAGIVTATSSNSLPGSLDARATSALDDNPKTAWTNAFGGNIGSWIQMQSATPVTLSSLNLKVIADGRHSVPTSLQLLVDGKAVRNITLPAIQDGKTADNTVSAPVSFAPVTGSTFRFVVKTERKENTEDYFNHGPLELPVAIAELGAPGLTVAKPAASLPTQCRRDLLTIDGKPIGVEVGGSSTAAVARDGLEVRLCELPVKLSAGTHTLLTARGSLTGIDLDRLVLSSAADQGAANPADAFPGDVRTTDTPRVTVTGEGPVAYRLSVSGAKTGTPFWLVLGQSLSPGWQAKLVGGSTLGPPQLIDGYANGWLINPTSSTMDIELDWTPQTKVWIGIGVSAVSLLICLLMVMRRGTVRLGRSAELDEVPGGEAMPYLVSPWRRDTAPLTKRRAAIAALLSAALAAVLITPLSGLIILAATLIGLFVPRGRLLLRVGSVATLAISAGYVMEVQARYDLPETGQWVQAFHKVATLSWLAVAFLVADLLVGWARREGKLDLVTLDAHPAEKSAPETT
jgi:arabinofuranan 3-O-arabinosyltransferase